MDQKIQLTDQTVKKQENRAVKDRGDDLKKNKNQRKIYLKYEHFNGTQSDRGDIRNNKEAKSHKVLFDKFKAGNNAVENIGNHEEENTDAKGVHDKREISNNVEEVKVNNVQRRENKELDCRRRIGEKYTIKHNNIGNLKKEDNDKNDFTKTSVSIKSKHKNEEQLKHETVIKADRDPDATMVARKTPHVETTVTKNDNTQAYKTVTFIKPKSNKTTSLQIDILREIAKSKPDNSVNCNKANAKTVKIDIEDKPIRSEKLLRKVKKVRKFRKAISPDPRKVASPSTEVAKWAPNCLNHHTKPYYEAWVNTTLTAVNKDTKQDEIYLKTQDATNQPIQKLVTDSVMYKPGDLTNEMFTGRIKIRHKANSS